MGGRLPGGFSIRGLSGGERRRLNIAAGAGEFWEAFDQQNGTLECPVLVWLHHICSKTTLILGQV